MSLARSEALHTFLLMTYGYKLGGGSLNIPTAAAATDNKRISRQMAHSIHVKLSRKYVPCYVGNKVMRQIISRVNHCLGQGTPPFFWRPRGQYHGIMNFVGKLERLQSVDIKMQPPGSKNLLMMSTKKYSMTAISPVYVCQMDRPFPATIFHPDFLAPSQTVISVMGKNVRQ